MIFRRSFLSHSTEKLRNETLLCFKKFPASKKFMDKRSGVARFSVDYLLPHSTKAFRNTRSVFQKNFWYQKTLWKGVGDGGSITIFRPKSFAHRTEKLRKGTLLCFKVFYCRNNFIDKRGGGGREEVSRFSVGNFCLTVVKKL